jgi:hypothetical protein
MQKLAQRNDHPELRDAGQPPHTVSGDDDFSFMVHIAIIIVKRHLSFTAKPFLFKNSRGRPRRRKFCKSMTTGHRKSNVMTNFPGDDV